MEKSSSLRPLKFYSNLKRKLLQKSQRNRVEFLIQFEDFLECKKFFDFYGFPLLRQPSTRGDKYRKIYFVVSQILEIFFILVAAISLICHMREENFELSIENLGALAAFALPLVTFWHILHRNWKALMEVIEKLDEHFPHHGFEQHLYGVKKYLRKGKIMHWVVYLVYGMALTQFTSFMVEFKAWGWLTSRDFEWQPIFNFWYPFDTSSPAVYLPLHAIGIWLSVTETLVFFLVDFLLIDLLMILSMEFDILAVDIEEAKDAAALKKQIVIHQQLIEVAGKLEEIFSPLLLINILSTICLMFVAAFLAVNGLSVFFLFKYGAVFIVAVVHGFVTCYMAQKLKDASSSISFASYSMDWNESNVKFKKLMLIMMAMAQNGQKLTAWGFFDVSMETFYWILDTAYSYYSVLMGLYKR